MLRYVWGIKRYGPGEYKVQLTHLPGAPHDLYGLHAGVLFLLASFPHQCVGALSCCCGPFLTLSHNHTQLHTWCPGPGLCTLDSNKWYWPDKFTFHCKRSCTDHSEEVTTMKFSNLWKSLLFAMLWFPHFQMASIHLCWRVFPQA